MAAPATVNCPSLSIMVGVGGGEVTWKIEEEDKQAGAELCQAQFKLG